MDSKTHIRRVFGLILVAAILAFALQRILVPKGFGEAGHYRVDSLFEIMAKEPVHQGMKACGECHYKIFDLHEKDVHYNVKCEDCHGPGNLHVLYYSGEDDGSITEEAAALPKEYTLEGCLFCHRKLAARPRDFPQVDPADHYRFLHVDDPQTRCIECHSPHEPLFMPTKIADARIHPIIYECGYCHEKTPAADPGTDPNHPVIFVCRDCHPDLVADFETRKHAGLRCTMCHLFHKENETAGRILKNGSRRFCLLCHEKKPFRSEGGPPLIDFADHLGEMADLTEKDEEFQDPNICVECHITSIHHAGVLK